MYAFMQIEIGWLVYFGPKPNLESRKSVDRKERATTAEESYPAYAGRSRAADRFVTVGDVAF